MNVNDAREALQAVRDSLAQERVYTQPLRPLKDDTDAALDALAATLDAPTAAEVESPADRRDEPVTYRRLEDILATAWSAAALQQSDGERPLAYLLRALREDLAGGEQ